jgi:hypothetical protein
VLQVAESAHSDEDWAMFSEAPPPQPAPYAASLVGPLLAVESLAWAERLYTGLLAGSAGEDAAGRRVFTWPESPLAITVEDSGEPGARALLVDDWDGALPSHPRFGPPVHRR